MPPDLQEAQRKALEWYVQLAALPGWKAFAWHQVNLLATEHPALFADLPAQLTQAMQQRSSGGRPGSGG